MLNRKYYTFERNNYYYGKLLTSKDFQSEQEYMNDKRRFLNRTLHGSGVVCGMDVVIADDMSIILQSGFALDAGGREIVVPETQVIKLSTIDGYNDLKTDCACLGISYQENPVDPVYAVMDVNGADDGKRFNGVKEGYRLFLQDETDCVGVDKEEDRYIIRTLLYKDKDLTVTQYTPAYATKGNLVKVKLEILKTSHAPSIFSIQYDLSAESFKNGTIRIASENISLDYGENYVTEYELIPEEYIFGKNDVEFCMKNIEVQKSGDKEKIAKEFSVKVHPVLEDVLTYVLNNSYKETMDTQLEKSYDEKLWISKIRLIRNNNASIIDTVYPVPCEQYVFNTRQLMLINKLNEYLPKAREAMVENTAERFTQAEGSRTMGSANRALASGVFDMSLGMGNEIGKVSYSDEIMHGLGNGAVYVEVGVEYLSNDTKTKTNHEEIILGDHSIFVTDNSEEKIHNLDMAVKILPDRGTFIVGIRPKVKTGKVSIRIRWFAFKPEDLEKKVANIKEQIGCIMMQPDTIVLSPKATVHINPVFVNMPEEALSYTLLDPEGGKIDNNGMYTAPAQEGVYEVKASCISNPNIYTHAFMIVSQKKSEDDLK